MGVARGFTTPDRDIGAHISRAVERRDVPLIAVGSDAAAIGMSAVSGELTGAPGLALLESTPPSLRTMAALDQARRDRRPMIAITAPAAKRTTPSDLASATKASLAV